NDLWLTKMTSSYWDLVHRGVEDAHRLDIPTVIFHVSSTSTPPEISDIGLKRFSELLKKCEVYRINLALENLRRLDYLDALFAKFSSPYLKFCFDSGHANAFTKNIEQFPWEKYQSYLHCLHLHDNNGLRDQHLPPFLGTINWTLLISNLKRCQYQGPLTVESVKHPSLDLTEEAFLEQIKKAHVQMENLWLGNEN
ncbi:MAG TPA: TIM barrel protein, partial [Bacilli bacterium]|nr:TIM barrel protein [Bacilli bacterium]